MSCYNIQINRGTKTIYKTTQLSRIVFLPIKEALLSIGSHSDFNYYIGLFLQIDNTRPTKLWNPDNNTDLYTSLFFSTIISLKPLITQQVMRSFESMECPNPQIHLLNGGIGHTTEQKGSVKKETLVTVPTVWRPCNDNSDNG